MIAAVPEAPAAAVRGGRATSGSPARIALQFQIFSSRRQTLNSSDQLELFCLGRLPVVEQVPIEEHILSCPSCAAKAQEIQEYVNAMRGALKRREGCRSLL